MRMKKVNLVDSLVCFHLGARRAAPHLGLVGVEAMVLNAVCIILVALFAFIVLYVKE